MTKINHDLRSVDGVTIYHGQEVDGASGQGNLEMPNIFEESAAPIYPIGTRLVLGDRVFRYSYFPEAITYAHAGVISYTGKIGSAVDSYDAEQAVGTVEFKVNGTGDGDPVANYYAGGYILLGTAVDAVVMRILKSTASAYDSVYTTQYTVVLTLEQGIPVAIAANTDCDIFPNQFADVRMAFGSVNTANMKPFVGIPPRIFTALRYGWIQTWGPCFIVHNVADAIGDTSFWRQVTFVGDGSLEALHESIGDTQSNQIAGYTLAIGGAGSEWTMLMLDR